MEALQHAAAREDEMSLGNADAMLGWLYSLGQVRKRTSIAPLYTKNDDLPRQARDKHRESTQKEIRFLVARASRAEEKAAGDATTTGCGRHRPDDCAAVLEHRV
jgi:hypothetical protein